MEGRQNKSVLRQLCENRGKTKGFAVLIDPDKADVSYLEKCTNLANSSGASMIFIGGSLVFQALDPVFNQVRKLTDLPLVLFPGSAIQVTAAADAILFLSLISGRNPDYLIGNHVVAAPFLRKSGVEILPTGYMLVEGGQTTTVQYISQTNPLPSNKPEIAVATAIAGEMLGLRLLYMDAGSGAKQAIPAEVISAVSRHTDLPLIVGGGIRSGEQALAAYKAGADIIVVGNRVEEYPDFLAEIRQATDLANQPD